MMHPTTILQWKIREDPGRDAVAGRELTSYRPTTEKTYVCCTRDRTSNPNLQIDDIVTIIYGGRPGATKCFALKYLTARRQKSSC